eukprot:Selendium_serpulae@DN5894_c0_g1_i1.p1
MSFKSRGIGRQEGLEERHLAKSQADETAVEIQIKCNIEKIQRGTRSLAEQSERVEKRIISERIIRGLIDLMKEIKETIDSTKCLLRGWEVELAGDPMEKRKRQFTVDKLKKHLQSEEELYRKAQRKVESTAREIMMSGANPSPPPSPQTSTSGDSYQSPYKDRGEFQNHAKADVGGTPAQHENQLDSVVNFDDEGRDGADCENDSLLKGYEKAHNNIIQEAIIKERAISLKRIQNQVSQANQIFWDLANLVSAQDDSLDALEKNVNDSDSDAKLGVEELKKTDKAKRAARKRMLWFLAILFIAACLFLYSLFA